MGKWGLVQEKTTEASLRDDQYVSDDRFLLCLVCFVISFVLGLQPLQYGLLDSVSCEPVALAGLSFSKAGVGFRRLWSNPPGPRKPWFRLPTRFCPKPSFLFRFSAPETDTCLFSQSFVRYSRHYPF